MAGTGKQSNFEGNARPKDAAHNEGAKELNLHDPDVEHAIATHKFSDALVALRAYCMLEALRSGALEAIEKTQGLKLPRLTTLSDFIELCESKHCERYLRYTHPYVVWHANETKLRRHRDVAIIDLTKLYKLL
ncbi:MAG: hypothetical protein RMK18_01780 [Armatimonadota bacterium]|nr:hypothetical protein [Armatimonadota bacterium]MCX7776789.1 hypothetical protein [Armatimonadota bacterium]MDW8024586.1 hypothetical protein [Armatimonadota bacterium]